MDIKPIRTEQDYEAALARVDELMDAELGTPEGEELDVLVDVVEAYESLHVPMGYPRAVEAIEFRMEQEGLSARDRQPRAGLGDPLRQACDHDADGPCAPHTPRHTGRSPAEGLGNLVAEPAGIQAVGAHGRVVPDAIERDRCSPLEDRPQRHRVAVRGPLTLLPLK